MDNNQSSKPGPDEKYIGYVVGGSLKDTLSVRLTKPAQTVQEGALW